MLELYQFEHSAFCLKVRMAMNAKKLNFVTKNITPGIGQLEIFRLSGQRKVPLLIDGNDVITDSSNIIKFLDTKYPDNLLIPQEEKKNFDAILIEDWADTTFANAARFELFKSASSDPELRQALLPNQLPLQLQKIIENLPCNVFDDISEILPQAQGDRLNKILERLSILTKQNFWLVGNNLSIADISIAAQLSLLKFPASSGLSLAGKGCAGFKDNPKFFQLFEWRDNLETILSQAI